MCIVRVSNGLRAYVLWEKVTRFAFDSRKKIISGLSLEYYEARLGPYFPSPEDMSIPPLTGRLGFTLSGNGKRRLFAIGNYVNQRLLHPVHRWLARFLRDIPKAATFDQTKPLDRLAGASGTVYSIDLKSATDRWPLLVLFELMQSLFDRSFASSVVNSTLGTPGTFRKKHASVCFTTGQSLGYHASWPHTRYMSDYVPLLILFPL